MLYVFTDGHARTRLSRFFNQDDDFSQLDWDVINSKEWYNTEEDPDRKRRKQAELMVKGSVPVECIRYLLTYNEWSKTLVERMVEAENLNIPVHIKKTFYF
ncbi:MAG: DUF4433 domain-containing protein [Bacteroidetes bacterium]|nr:MAG: DUF4433 domain-containing protein [Bacteroidota bacterium]